MADECNDCGSAPVWRHSYNGKCRHCFDKGGHSTSVTIDLDVLDRIVGESVADMLIEASRHPYRIVPTALVKVIT